MDKRIYVVDGFGLAFTRSKNGDCFPCGVDSTKERMKMKKEDVLNLAEDFFLNSIKKEIKKKYYGNGWTCWHTGAISLVAVIFQQKRHFRMNALVYWCEYEQLVQLASTLNDIDDIKTLLHVCKTKEEHKKFYNVIKESFNDDEQFMPFFGHIEEDVQETIMTASDEEDYPSRCVRTSNSRMKKVLIGIGAAALIALAAICIL